MRRSFLAVVVGGVAMSILVALAPAARGETLPAGFDDSVVLSGLNYPTDVRFSPDGRIFVTEKAGLVKVFDDLSDTSPTTFADLRTNVADVADRGMLGIALDPGFPQQPYVYVLYSFDAPIGGTAPTWNDSCPGGEADGCVIGGRLSRLTAAGNTMTGSEKVLVEDWCQQFLSHSIGTVAFGPDGALYAGGGEGANYLLGDYGQSGDPPNPCGDPPTGVGGTQTAPTAEGGALRAQDIRTTADPTGLSGTLIRVNPSTGAALPDNPLAGSTDPNARRIVAYGFRNPYRFTFRPGTNEIWVGDVGWNSWEEIDRIPSPTSATTAPNYGWPCYEGPARQQIYDSLDLNLCEGLYASPGAVTGPVFGYQKAHQVAGETCPTGNGSVTSGISFYPGGAYPSTYNGALFFGDYARGCIFVMRAGPSGQPDPTTVAPFAQGAAAPVDLEIGPGGDLYYVDIVGGTVRRIRYFPGNRPPDAVAEADPTEGGAPLHVQFDAGGSSDPDADPLTYAWDLDDDGQFDDSSAVAPTKNYPDGDHVVRLRVSDPLGASDTASITIHSGNTSPSATIVAPAATDMWYVGEQIPVSGLGDDAEDDPGQLTYSWSVILEHCPTSPTDCHQHFWQSMSGAQSSFDAPDHEYPAHLLLGLTVTDSRGLTGTDEVRLDPMTADVTLSSTPAGAQLTLGTFAGAAPFTRTVILDSNIQVSAPTEQQLNGVTMSFESWSDGGDRVHEFVAQGDRQLTAHYEFGPALATGSCTDRKPPHTTLRHRNVHVFARSLYIRGRSADRGCAAAGSLRGAVAGLKRVYVFVEQHSGRSCRFLGGDGHLTGARRCGHPLLLRAKGEKRFHRLLKANLAPGPYVAGALARDRDGNLESPRPRNEVGFRVG